MADTFENALFTIAATRSKDHSTGCYATTDTGFIAHLVSDGTYVRKQPPKFPKHWTQRNNDMWPLLNRDWIYQEMRLSSRVLHFCSQEVIWECRSVRRSESGWSDEELGVNESRYAHIMYDQVPYLTLVSNPKRLWYRTVQKYSQLQLTFEKDTLPALSALAERMESLRPGDRYLAGIWEKTLLLDLLWMVWPSPKSGRPERLRSPTWSWPSVRSQVMWDETDRFVLESVKLKEICCTTVGPIHMGELSDASITLQAPLLKATISRGELELDGPQNPNGEVVVYNYKKDYDFNVPGDYSINSGSAVFILPIGTSKVNYHHAGIVLRRKADSSHYERFGYLQFMHRDYDEFQKKESRDRFRSRHHRSYPDTRRKLAEAGAQRVESILTSLPVSDVTIV